MSFGVLVLLKSEVTSIIIDFGGVQSQRHVPYSSLYLAEGWKEEGAESVYECAQPKSGA